MKSIPGALRQRLRQRSRVPAVRLRSGTDLVAVEQVSAALQQFGLRYLERVYCRAELDYCRSGAGWNAERLAARFALKEAVIKLLQPDAHTALPWTCIELRKGTGGALQVVLSGNALELARRAGIGEISASISHEREYACAVAVAAINNRF